MAGSEEFFSTKELSTVSILSNTSVILLGVGLTNGNRVGSCGQGNMAASRVSVSGTGCPLLFLVLWVSTYQINAAVTANAINVTIKVNIFHIRSELKGFFLPLNPVYGISDIMCVN